MQKNNKSIIVGLMFIVLGVSIFFSKEYKKYTITLEEKNSVACYLNDKVSKYIAILEIPKISFKRGLTDEDNIDLNISFVSGSKMPNEIGYTIIAGHSGNSDNAYFNDLDKLKQEDLVYLYYENDKYIYNVSDIQIIDKTGKLVLNNINVNKLVLVTCKKNTNKQIIIICELIKKEKI